MASPALKLYEATDAIEIVRVWLEEHDNEIRLADGVLNPELAELLAQVEGDFDQKAERVGLFIRELEHRSKAIKLEEERLYSRRKSTDSQVAGLKAYLEINMKSANRPRVEGMLMTLRIQKNPPSCIVERDFTQEQLRELFLRNPLVVTYHPPIAESFSINAREIIIAAKQMDGKKILGYKSTVEGIRVEQSESLRLA